MAMMKWSLAIKGEKLEAAIVLNGHWLQKERNQNWDQHQHGIIATPTSSIKEDKW